MICEICKNFSCETLQQLSTHIKSHNVFAKEYYDLYMNHNNGGKCKTCGCNTLFLGMGKGYRSFCSLRCRAISQKDTIRNNNIFSYKNFEVLDASNKTSILCKCNLCSQTFSRIVYFIRKHGEKSCPFCFKTKKGFENNVESNIEKQIKKYGMPFSQTNEFKEKRKQTLIRKINEKLKNKPIKILEKNNNTYKCLCEECNHIFSIKCGYFIVS